MNKGGDGWDGNLGEGGAATPWTIQALTAAASIVLSAATYLLDFGSNMVVVAEYGRRYAKFVSLEQRQAAVAGNATSPTANGTPICGAECRHQTSEITGYFTAMVAVLFCSHTLNALIFWFKFRSRTHPARAVGPFRAAYFLPLIHLWRLADLTWRTLSFQGVEGLRSDDMNGLYNILASAFESVPMLILQFCAYIVLVKVGLLLEGMTLLFKVSVAASLLSTACNGGTSVQSVARNGAATVAQKLNVMASAGAFTLFATISRCLTYANMLVWQREHFWRDRTERERARFHASDSIPLLFLGGTVMGYWLFYWLLLPLPRSCAGDSTTEAVVAATPSTRKRARDAQRCVAAVGMAYMSILVGPLYCILSEVRSSSAHEPEGRAKLATAPTSSLGVHGLLFLVATVNICVDVGMLGLTFSFNNLPSPYLVASLVSAVGYLLSIAWFIQTDYTLQLAAHGHPPSPVAGQNSVDVDDRRRDAAAPADVHRLDVPAVHQHPHSMPGGHDHSASPLLKCNTLPRYRESHIGGPSPFYDQRSRSKSTALHMKVAM